MESEPKSFRRLKNFFWFNINVFVAHILLHAAKTTVRIQTSSVSPASTMFLSSNHPNLKFANDPRLEDQNQADQYFKSRLLRFRLRFQILPVVFTAWSKILSS